MKTHTRYLSLLVLAALLPAFLPAQSPARMVTDKMLAAMANLKGLKYSMRRTERIEGKMVTGEMVIKLARNPFRVFAFEVSPKLGTELLYKENWNEGKIMVHPNSFPFVTLSLDPFGSLALENQHHPITHMGLDYLLDVVKFVLKKYEPKFDQYVKIKGETTWKERACYGVEITYDDYRFEPYTVLQGEDLFSIGNKLKLPPYKLMEYNKLKSFFGLKAGQVIQVPTVYSPKVYFLVDKVWFLPIYQAVYDEKGLFEQYEYLKCEVNPAYKADEFDPSFAEYNFK